MESRNNHVIRKIRYALNLRDSDMVKIFELGGYKTDEITIRQFTEKDNTPNFRELKDDVLENFLDGLITYKRGKKENSPPLKVKRVLMPENKQNFK